MVFDTEASDAVWNFPAYETAMTVTETTDGAGATRVNINTASAEELDALPGIGPSKGQSIIDYRETYGPFQVIDDIVNVSGIGNATFNDLKDLITVDPVTRTFDVTAKVKFATDGVDATHVDNGSPDARGFVNTYNYTLTTDENGVVLSGTWENDSKHPDFAWVPYHNASRDSGGSENPFLAYDVYTAKVKNLERH